MSKNPICTPISQHDDIEGWITNQSDSDAENSSPYRHNLTHLQTHHNSVHPATNNMCVQASMQGSTTRKVRSTLPREISKNTNKLQYSDCKNTIRANTQMKPSIRISTKPHIMKKIIELNSILGQPEILELMPSPKKEVVNSYNSSFDSQDHSRAYPLKPRKHKRMQSLCLANKNEANSTLLDGKNYKIQESACVTTTNGENNKSVSATTTSFPCIVREKQNPLLREFVFPSFSKIRGSSKNKMHQTGKHKLYKVQINDYLKKVAEYSDASILLNDESPKKYEWKCCLDPKKAIKMLSNYYSLSEEFAMAIVIKFSILAIPNSGVSPTSIYNKVVSNMSSFADLMKIVKERTVNFSNLVKPWLSSYLSHKSRDQCEAIYYSIINGNAIVLNEFIELILVIKYKQLPCNEEVEFILKAIHTMDTKNISKYSLLKRLKFFQGNTEKNGPGMVFIYTALDECFKEDLFSHQMILEIDSMRVILDKNKPLRDKIYNIILN